MNNIKFLDISSIYSIDAGDEQTQEVNFTNDSYFTLTLCNDISGSLDDILIDITDVTRNRKIFKSEMRLNYFRSSYLNFMIKRVLKYNTFFAQKGSRWKITFRNTGASTTSFYFFIPYLLEKDIKEQIPDVEKNNLYVIPFTDLSFSSGERKDYTLNIPNHFKELTLCNLGGGTEDIAITMIEERSQNCLFNKVRLGDSVHLFGLRKIENDIFISFFNYSTGTISNYNFFLALLYKD